MFKLVIFVSVLRDITNYLAGKCYNIHLIFCSPFFAATLPQTTIAPVTGNVQCSCFFDEFETKMTLANDY